MNIDRLSPIPREERRPVKYFVTVKPPYDDIFGCCASEISFCNIILALTGNVNHDLKKFVYLFLLVNFKDNFLKLDISKRKRYNYKACDFTAKK